MDASSLRRREESLWREETRFDSRVMGALLAADVALVTYDSETVRGGRAERVRRSSIWTRTNGGWVLRVHQGTPIADDACATEQQR